MKIRQTKGVALLAEQSRRRLENTAFPNLERARQEVQHLFPHHLVLKSQGSLTVVVKDRSFHVATFHEVLEAIR